ncbi:uncharacterized protein MONBRDRAFT_29099 [Monosiga brevicollis MX1]|uniref:Myotubularin phosphatase domain-containing protein n=1 Tax=Monosiga brevicollis TaxID=81824 RepID=A9VA44_MONBE|nr:uncharacterized protein MONBRDRAFT_29099 [Monosiga brevicollis MX1]EDQ85601.1 predicted protein [Monosiga brevicollis MX1]|eukprot:XP_001749550.1 hypothetical protein [Monosiga brevicollis MX1]
MMFSRSVSKYRQNGRFPMLCFLHPKTKMPLLRSGQPLAGSSGKRKYEDEQMLRMVLSTADVKQGLILDTRTSSVASTHRSKGGGLEVIDKYYGWSRKMLDIAAWPILADSLSKLLEACQDPSLDASKFLEKLNASNWLSTVRDALSAALQAVTCLEHEQQPVVVHGSHGTDITCIVVALAQLYMDPYFRTLEGFCKLVEKEWLHAGHPFASRWSPLTRHNKTERAPVFLLFLDCVYQSYFQFCAAFEFNESFLMELYMQSYSCVFGTFVGDCEAMRAAEQLDKKTRCFWRHALSLLGAAAPRKAGG